MFENAAPWGNDNAEPVVEEIKAEVVEEVAEPAPTPAPKKRRRRAPSALNPAMVRRVAEKTVDVSSANADVVEATAKVLGVDNDPVEVSVAILAGTEKFSAMSIIDKVRSTDSELEGGLEINALTRGQVTTTWSAARALGAGLDKNPPANEMKAVIALTQKIRGIADGSLIEQVAALIEVS